MKLKVENLSCSYNGELVLNQLNMSVKDREFVSILGPSGCGKSTLLNILAGVLAPDEGSVYVDGVKINGLSPHFAYMPQQDLLMPWKTILENVTIYGAIHHNKKMVKKQAISNFKKFGLSGYENRYPKELSGGMRQRAAFLRTALCGADIMLLDEPFGALDVITRGVMQDWLQDIRSDLNRTAILVTHDIDEAIYLSDRVLILAGKPASFKKEIIIKADNRNREWLFRQRDLHREIYYYLKKF
ncbi:MAG: ABC transporter ATP-binding protein [Anaerovoracaceae bacterium]|jgi:NitT/TauT family transport system ATP-binding protein|nr:ABC transporter ATP-binding protein [Clostridiales bacterium]